MYAIGSLFVLFIYFVLSAPALLLLGLLVLNRKSLRTLHYIYFIVASIPLVLFSTYRYTEHREAELEWVGYYYLTDYPNCLKCVLELDAGNRYRVFENDSTLESGQWDYDHGGDYFIVSLGEYGQLGSGKYAYHEYLPLKISSP